MDLRQELLLVAGYRRGAYRLVLFIRLSQGEGEVFIGGNLVLLHYKTTTEGIVGLINN